MSVQALPNAGTKVVRVGSRIRMEDEDGMVEFVMTAPEEANALRDHVSADSPVGRAVLGQAAGALVMVETRLGRRRARIVSIEEDQC